MRKFLVVMMVFGLATVAGADDPVTSMGLNGPNNGQVGGLGDGGIMWDNGPFNGLNGLRPTDNWDPLGLMDDLTIPQGSGTAFNSVHIEQADGTSPLGQPSLIDTMRIRIYEVPAGGMGGLDHDIDVPVFDQTFSEAGGDLVETDSGEDAFGRDLVYFDATLDAPWDLGAGTFAMFLTYPGQGPIDSFWVSSSPAIPGEIAHVFGPGLNTPNTFGLDMAFNLGIPEPASLSLLAIGALAMLRRRR